MSKPSSQFSGHAYQPQEEDVYFDDGREIELLHFVYNHQRLSEMRGNPQKVIEAIDEYARTKKYLMNIGPYKSQMVVDIIKSERPRVLVELGGYIGYSAIAFGAALRDAGGQQYFSLERNPEFGAVIASLVDLAGLSSTVKVVVGGSAASLKRLHEENILTKIDLLFLDHYKPAYTTDLKLCESLRLIEPGSVLVADNVVKPGNPPYLEYVRSSVAQKRKKLEQRNFFSDQDPFQESTKHQYSKRQGEEILDDNIFGNPDLIYESKFLEGWEPSGVPDAVEVTRCTGIESPPNK